MQRRIEGPLLTSTEFKVFKCVPPFWFDEDVTVREIAAALGVRPGVVKGHVTRFVSQALIERRVPNTIHRRPEVRRLVRIVDTITPSK
jgi:DNA-binding MarR family transcriptional regulator